MGAMRKGYPMGTRSTLALLASTALLAGCASSATVPTATQDVDFMRGCWVAKDLPGGPPQAFLRLLPDGADGPAYSGSVIDVRNGQWTPGVRFEFARDGTQAIVTNPGDAPRTYVRTEDSLRPAASEGAMHVVYTDARGLLEAIGRGDTLSIREGAGSPVTLWPFERDGCD